MLFNFLGTTNAMITHVLTTAFFADFEICVAVELSDVGSGNPTLAVQSVNILTHDVFEMILLREFDHRHVCLGRVSLLDARSESPFVCNGLGLLSASRSCFLLIRCILLLISGGFPAARSCSKDSIMT